MYDPKQKLNIFSKNKYFLILSASLREKDIIKEKQIRELGLGI